MLSRRSVVQGAASLALAGVAGSRATRATSPVGTPVATPAGANLIGYAFNARTQDVTLFDPRTQIVLETKPLGAVVRWLSNEQRFWDGRHIWSYDFPDNEVQAIGIDPHAVAVARILPTGGAGPAHSLMLRPDLRQAWVNVAGDDSIAVFDLSSGSLIHTVETGKFP
jgi:hypothetical protein